MPRLKYIVPVAMGLLAVSLPVRASVLEGQTVLTSYFRLIAPDMTQITDAFSVVGEGGPPELVNFADFVTIDFFDTNIRITAIRNALPVCCPQDFLLRFSDLNQTIPAITGITINPATTYAGFTASALSLFGGDVIDVHLAGLAGQAGQVISLDLAGAPVAAVPEPSTAALFGLGIALCCSGARGKTFVLSPASHHRGAENAELAQRNFTAL